MTRFRALGLFIIAIAALSAVKASVRPERAPDTAEILERANFAARADAARVAIAALRGTLREPASLQIEEVFARDPPQIVCIAYHAKNGMNGTTRTGAVVIGGVVSSDPTIWNKRCVGDGFHSVNVAYL